MAILSEADIAHLLADRKPITSAELRKLKSPRKSKKYRNDLVATVTLTGATGKKYRVMARQDRTDEMNFSVRLSIGRSRGATLNLIRCNGHHGPHKNHIERTTIPANTCHIHRITERYQHFTSAAPEQFAELTDGYNSFNGAVDFFAEHFGLYLCDGDYKSLFPLFRDLD
jgi:hypothetical protein